MIGVFGPIKFRVSDNKILTFNDLSISRGMKLAEHDVPWYKGRLEVTGENLDEVTMDIILNASFGVRPRRQAEIIRQLMHQKVAHYLVIGGVSVMDRRCIIIKMGENWKYILNGGEVPDITIPVTFKEYQ